METELVYCYRFCLRVTIQSKLHLYHETHIVTFMQCTKPLIYLE